MISIKKYDSSVNLDNYSDRATMGGRFDLIGFLLKHGLVDIETLYCVEGMTMISAWIKFKPIIEEYRKFAYGKDLYEHWEYLANEMAKCKEKKDPSWRYSAVDIFQQEEYDRTFSKK